MPETIRIALDIIALLAVIYAIGRGFFKASADVTMLTRQITINTAWIKGHEEWSIEQTKDMQEIREDIAFIRGRIEHVERIAADEHDRN